MKTQDRGSTMVDGCRRSISHVSLLLVLSVLAGCKDSADSTGNARTGPGNAAVSREYSGELLGYAIDNLNRLEQFDSADILRQVVERLSAEDQAEGQQTDSLLAAWPEPEMLRQIVDRLNQWIRTQRPPTDWKLDPMIGELPKRLADLPQIGQLDSMEFSRFDGYALREAVWLRDVSLWASGETLDDLQRAKSLFDWTVRNVQIEADRPDRIPLLPWETLLFGRGTATERAWVFILLARQLRIEAAMLGLDAETDTTDEASMGPRPWCVAVLVEGNAYLFEPLLGLPIPAPDGITFDETGQLDIRPATLAQVASDEKLLRRLDADETHVYGVKGSDLKRVTVMLEASPTYLARRMNLLESCLIGPRKMVLTTSPTASAKHWKTVAPAADVRLWPWPFETLDRRSHLDRKSVLTRLAALLPFYATPSAPLYEGRMLHLRGKFVGDDGATRYYQEARPSNAELLASSAPDVEKLLYLRGKQDASYWLGLIAYQRESYPAAIDYFTKRKLRLLPDNPWANGTRYNLARTFEAAGEPERAVLQYNGNTDSPGYLGDLLRAKWLQQQSHTRTEATNAE